MIETYWQEMFGEFKLENGKFEIPGFPEPLMSAHYGVQNLLGETNLPVTKTFKLCYFQPLDSTLPFTADCEPMARAIGKTEFWDFQKEHNIGAFNFISRLLPFLLGHNSDYRHYFLKSRDGLKASALVGWTKSACFGFNLCVDQNHRGEGSAKFLVEQIRIRSYPLPMFYWTTLPWFTLDAQTVEYHLRDNSRS